MGTSDTQQKFSVLFQMLIELAMGDLTFRIPAVNNSLEKSLNIFASQLQWEIDNAEHTDSFFSFEGIVRYVIIVDNTFIIKAFNTAFSEKLSYPTTELLGIQFISILAGNWEAVLQHFQEQLRDKKTDRIINLLFKTANDFIVPASCIISDIQGTADILITSVSINVGDRITLNKSTHTPSDIETTNTATPLYRYIMGNLTKPLPGIKMLCRIIGTNEFTLKSDFRKQYNCSIYQFYNNHRLKRAHLMVQQTAVPLKEIALNSGFKNYATFFKAFKKKYNYAPGQLLRKL